MDDCWGKKHVVQTQSVFCVGAVLACSGINLKSLSNSCVSGQQNYPQKIYFNLERKRLEKYHKHIFMLKGLLIVY